MYRLERAAPSPERRHHLSGPVGVAIHRRCLQLGWVRHHLDSRAVSVTATGGRGLCDWLGIAWPESPR